MFRPRNLVVAGLLLAAVVIGGAALSARSVPKFYRESLALPPQSADRAGDEFTQASFALANEVREAGRWSGVFTDEQLNGWLAVDLPTKHADLVPDGFWNPRIRFDEDRVQVGVSHRVANVRTVVWLDVEVSMSGSHEAALRFHRARAGRLPLPLGGLLDGVSQLANDLQVPIRWTTVDGDPTALIGLPALGKEGLRYDLDKLKVSRGQIFISGHTTQFVAAEGETKVR